VNPFPELNLPAEAAVMVLPNAVLVPHALLPLCIFEPQYRAMLQWTLEQDRLFAIALRRPGADPELAENFFPVGGLGLVRACVASEDGTSNLILQGLARVEFGGLVKHSGAFRIAKIKEFRTRAPDTITCEALALRLVELCGQIRSEVPQKLVQKLRELTEPEMIADIVTQTFMRDPIRQQEVLEEVLVSERIRMLIRYLEPKTAV
jgi:Lon protease-like protein